MSPAALIAKKNLSLHRVSVMLGCSETCTRTLADSGELKHRRVPHRNKTHAREFAYDDVILFMRQNGYAVADVEAASVVVAVAGAPPHWSLRLIAAVKPADYVLVRLASTQFEAGLLVGEKRPKALVVDTLIGRSDALLILAAARARGVDVVVAVVGEDEDRPNDFAAAGCHHVHRRPADPLAVIAQILTSLEPADARPQ